MIAANFNIGRNHTGPGTGCSAKHNVLAGGGQEIIDYLYGAGIIPDDDGLRLFTKPVNLTDVVVDGCEIVRIAGNASADALRGTTMDITTVHNHVMWPIEMHEAPGVWRCGSN